MFLLAAVDGRESHCSPLLRIAHAWASSPAQLRDPTQAVPIQAPGSVSPPARECYNHGPGLRISGPARSGRFGHVACARASVRLVSL
ncbi:hypothetical protein V8C37DRAFT_369374, partial [Trichoderma ceciliae]